MNANGFQYIIIELTLKLTKKLYKLYLNAKTSIQFTMVFQTKFIDKNNYTITYIFDN